VPVDVDGHVRDEEGGRAAGEQDVEEVVGQGLAQPPEELVPELAEQGEWDDDPGDA